MASADIEAPIARRLSVSMFAGPGLLAGIAGVVAAMVGGLGDGRWAMPPDWKLGLMFGIGALLAASTQVFLQQSFELARKKRRLLDMLDEQQAEADAWLDAVREQRSGEKPSRPALD